MFALDRPWRGVSRGVRKARAAPRHFPLRWLLLAYGFLLAAPLLTLLGLFFLRSVALERQASELRLTLAAEDLASDIDRDIARQFTTLRVLASLPSVAARDWATFYDRAKAALRDEAYVIVIDRELRQLANTYVAFGTQPTLTGDPATALRVIATGEPAVSDLFISRVTKGPVYNSLLPIKESGRVEFILILGIKTSDLLPIFKQNQIAEGWYSSVWDKNDVVLADSRRPELVGSKLPAALTRDAVGDRGLIRTEQTKDEGPAWRALVPSGRTGWRISVAAPTAVIEGPLQHSARLWGGLGLATAFLSLLLSALLARLLTASFGRLREAAMAVGDHKPIEPQPAWTVREAAIVHDVIEESRREIERRERLLRESNDRLDGLIQSATDAVIAIDSDQRIVLFNPAAERMFACQQADVMGSLLDRFIPGTVREVHSNHDRPFAGTLSAVRANGTEFPIEASISQITVGGRKLYTAIIRDISERKQTEDRLRAQAALLDLANDAIIVRGPKDEITFWNRGAEATYGWTPDEALGRVSHELLQTRYPGRLDQLRSETNEKGRWEGELTHTRKDGQVIVVASRWALERDGAGRPVGILEINRDISERKKAEEDQKFFMRELAHRMKNQMAVIQAMASQTARTSDSIEEFRLQFSRRVQGLAVSTNLLIDGGWNGSRLAELVEHQLEPFEPGTERLSCSGPSVWISIDATQAVSLALHELATNSVKHGAWSDAHGKVTVSWHIDADAEGLPALHLTWVERGGPPAVQPSRRGFGYAVIESLAAQKVGGEARLDFAPEGLSWSLTIPATQFRQSGTGRMASMGAHG